MTVHLIRNALKIKSISLDLIQRLYVLTAGTIAVKFMMQCLKRELKHSFPEDPSLYLTLIMRTISEAIDLYITHIRMCIFVQTEKNSGIQPLIKTTAQNDIAQKRVIVKIVPSKISV